MALELSSTIRQEAGFLPLKYENGRLLILDQRKLPKEIEYVDSTSLTDICLAIKEMIVRGAPSIGVAAAFGFALEANRTAASWCHERDELSGDADGHGPLNDLRQIKETLDRTRPTAVNLRWATEKMLDCCQSMLNDDFNLQNFRQETVARANQILSDHIQKNMQLSQYGLAVMPENANIITHCNAGPLATCGWGTALGVIRMAEKHGLKPHVFVDETRPRNQGAKLTMWELMQDSIPCTLVCDNMSGFLMSNKKIDLVIVGADRIARNGDTANKIGTYNLAIVARHHSVPFYIAAPLSTFDSTISSGFEIPIEQRDTREISCIDSINISVPGAAAFNPAFDVTPAHLITGIITESGILYPPYENSIVRALELEV